MTRTAKLAFLAATSIALALSAHASDWTGNGGNWSSDLNPGWNGTGVPNAIGAIANFGTAPTAASTTVQDIVAGVTVGTISYTNTANFVRTITNTNGITMNQDSAGAGTATISNTNTNVGANNALVISAGTLTLADDLLVSNTGASANTTGAIQIVSAITGTGNVTFSNVSNALSQTGSIRLQTGINTFTGAVLIQQGTTSYNLATAFGNAANVVTVGQSGLGGATLISTAAVGSNNNIVVAAGATGPLTVGSVSTAGTGGTYAGSFTLNSNVTLTSANTGVTTGLKFTGNITGAGGIIKSGAGFITLNPTTGVNTYAGGTLINLGGVAVLKDGGLGTGNVSLTASGVSLTLQGALANDYINNAAGISIVTGATANLNFTGTDNVAAIVLAGVNQAAFGTYGAVGSGADFTSAFFVGTGTLTLVPEPATYMLFGLGVLVCAQQFRRKSKKA